MSWWDAITQQLNRPFLSDVSWSQLEKEHQAKAETENQANLIKAHAESEALKKGFTLEEGLLSKTTKAGSPESGLAQNQSLNFLDILKWNIQNASSSYQETGKDKASVLIVNTPTGDSQTKTTPQGTSITQKSGDQPQNQIDWFMIVVVAGIVIIVITLIKKR